MRILLAEDDRMLNRALCYQLENLDFQVDSCLDGEDALFYGEQNIYDVILLDRMQPDGGNVLLRVILEFLNPFRGLARTDYHHPRSKRVEGTGMAYFQLLLLYPPADVVTRMSHNLERCPSQRFIEIEDFSFFKIHWPLP